MPLTFFRSHDRRSDDEPERVDGRELEPPRELGSDDRLLRGLLLRVGALVRAHDDDSERTP
jgi:hypothetical protein